MTVCVSSGRASGLLHCPLVLRLQSAVPHRALHVTIMRTPR
jgi:hypothetical protein